MSAWPAPVYKIESRPEKGTMLTSDHGFAFLLGKHLHPLNRKKLSTCSKRLDLFISVPPSKPGAACCWKALNPELMIAVAKHLRPRIFMRLLCVNKQTRNYIDCDAYWSGPAIHCTFRHMLMTEMKNRNKAVNFPKVKNLFGLVDLPCSYAEAMKIAEDRARFMMRHSSNPELAALPSAELALEGAKLCTKAKRSKFANPSNAKNIVQQEVLNFKRRVVNMFEPENFMDALYHLTMCKWVMVQSDDVHFSATTRNFFKHLFISALRHEDRCIRLDLRRLFTDPTFFDHRENAFWSYVRDLFADTPYHADTAEYFICKYRHVYKYLMRHNIVHHSFNFAGVAFELEQDFSMNE